MRSKAVVSYESVAPSGFPGVLLVGCSSSQHGTLSLTLPLGDWASSVEDAYLHGVVRLKPPYTDSSFWLEIRWYSGGEYGYVVLDSDYLRGGGGVFSIQASEQMLSSVRAAGSSYTVQIEFRTNSTTTLQFWLSDIQLCCFTSQPVVDVPAQSAPVPVDPVVLRSRFCGERRVEPFLLLAETAVPAMHRQDRLASMIGNRNSVWDQLSVSQRNRLIGCIEQYCSLWRYSLLREV